MCGLMECNQKDNALLCIAMGPTNFPANCNQNSCPLVPQYVSMEPACCGILLKLKYKTINSFKLIALFSSATF